MKKSKQGKVVKCDGTNSINIHDSSATAAAAGAGMTGSGPAGQWSRRARCVGALAAVLGYLLLMTYLKAQYHQVQRLNRLLDFEKNSEEMLKNLELLDHQMSMKLEQVAALHRPP